MDAAKNLASIGWALLIAGAICFFVGKGGYAAGAIAAGAAALGWNWISRRRPPPQ